MSHDSGNRAAPADVSLLRRLRAGSEEAAQEIVARYAERLKALARAKSSALLAAKEDPDDIVQSAFGSFFRGVHGGRYQVPAGQDLWNLLLVIALNKVRAKGHYHRAAKRDARVTYGGVALESYPTATDLQASTDFREMIDEALERLPELSQRMVSMRIEGYSLQEISTATQRTCRTVERVLKAFREILTVSLAENG